MKKTSIAALGGALLMSAFVPMNAAYAQMAPTGAEIVGHAVQVDTNGVVNTVYFDPGGQARIVTPQGREVQGQWAVQNQSICLQTGTAQECWPYQAAFQQGMPVTLTSNCSVTSRWTALSTNQPPAPQQQRSGERG